MRRVQNMERYFGFRVKIQDELDPVRIDALKGQAEKIILAYDFNPEEYFVYFHQLSIYPKEEHFGIDGGLASRLKLVEIRFSVNKKQRQKRKIQFFNFLLDMTPSEQVKTTGGADEFTHYIEGSYLAQNLGYRNEIVTFISKKVRDSHRKIKISLTAYPTAQYSEILHRGKNAHLTQFDYKFQRPIALRAPANVDRMLSCTGERRSYSTGGNTIMTGDTYLIFGQSSATGKNATSHGTTNQQILNNDNDYEQLARELEEILENLNKEDEVSKKIDVAIDAAKTKDDTALRAAIKSAGKRVLDISEKIGTTVAAAYIKSQLGL